MNGKGISPHLSASPSCLAAESFLSRDNRMNKNVVVAVLDHHEIVPMKR